MRAQADGMYRNIRFEVLDLATKMAADCNERRRTHALGFPVLDSVDLRGRSRGRQSNFRPV
jgi:hypothetical protein